MLKIIGGLLVAWGILDFGLSLIGIELYGAIGINLPIFFITYSPYIASCIGAALFALEDQDSTPYVPRTPYDKNYSARDPEHLQPENISFDDENSSAPDSEDLQPENVSLSGQEIELQRIKDLYEKSLINDEERTAMRKKVLGIE